MNELSDHQSRAAKARWAKVSADERKAMMSDMAKKPRKKKKQ